MGFFDFVKKAGTKLFTREADAQERTPAGPSPEEVRRQADRRLAAALVKFVGDLGLEVEDLSVRVDGDVATIKGKTASQAEREKVVLAVGNVEGVSRVDDQLTVEREEPEAVFYTVQSGDTLSKIAKQHYGNAGKYPVIFEANKPMLKHPDRIYPGQVLRIPPQAG